MDLSTHWLLWQILDSGFPTGGFAHSGGLEAAWQHGEVPNRQELQGFAQASLWQAGRSQLPVVLATYRRPEQLAELDELYHAFTSNHVANRASRAQGRALTTALQRVFPQNRELNSSPSQSPAPIGHPHFAPAFGAAMRHCGVEEPSAAGAFLFNHLRGLLASAVRLNSIGPMEAQALQFQLFPLARQIAEQCATLGIEDAAQCAPLLDLWQGAQDRLYSRLFQS